MLERRPMPPVTGGDNGDPRPLRPLTDLSAFTTMTKSPVSTFAGIALCLPRRRAISVASA
jgi:hypothetical protein